MPPLEKSKRSIAQQFTDRHTSACGQFLMTDAVDTALCGWLSGSAVVVVGLGSWIGWWWANPTASLANVYVALRVVREAWRGDGD